MGRGFRRFRRCRQTLPEFRNPIMSNREHPLARLQRHIRQFMDERRRKAAAAREGGIHGRYGQLQQRYGRP
jgi:hypothetical protein